MFEHIQQGERDSFFYLKQKLTNDTSPDKIDVGAGIFRNEEGKYQEFSVIKKAKKILEAKNLRHSYGYSDGDPLFLKLGAEIMFGSDSPVLAAGKVASVQSLSGSGANHLGAVLLSRSFDPTPNIYITVPTWINTIGQFDYLKLETHQYNYLDRDGKFNIVLALETIQSAPSGSVFVFQGCCHNPSGVDITVDQWRQIGQELKKAGSIPFIDIAYHGLGSGLDKDAAGVRILADEIGLEVIVCQSFSKNFALYGERCGIVHVVCKSSENAANVKDQIRGLLRREYSSPPAFGSRLVTIVLEDEELRKEWLGELESMRARLKTNRHDFTNEFRNMKTPGSWDHIEEEIGLFSDLKLTPEQCDVLTDKYHVHLPRSGRINIAGLTPTNIPKVAKAVDAVVREVPAPATRSNGHA